MELLCMGLAVCDIIASPLGPEVFQKDTVMLKSLCYKPGGDAYNVASTATRLGIPTALAAVLGNDPPGGMLMTSAKEQGIGTAFLACQNKVSTATSLVLVTKGGERHFAYSQGANALLSPDLLSEEALKNTRHLHVSGAMLLPGLDGEGLAVLFEKAHSFGLTTSLDVAHDPDGLWMKKIERALWHTDLFLPSLEEAQKIAGRETPEDIAGELSRFPFHVLAIKLGAAGSFVQTREARFYMPAVTKGPVVDTTGAGDCYVAVFLAALLKGCTAWEAAVYATAGAGCCVGQIGADCGFQSFSDLERLAGRIDSDQQRREWSEICIKAKF